MRRACSSCPFCRCPIRVGGHRQRPDHNFVEAADRQLGDAGRRVQLGELAQDRCGRLEVTDRWGADRAPGPVLPRPCRTRRRRPRSRRRRAGRSREQAASISTSAGVRGPAGHRAPPAPDQQPSPVSVVNTVLAWAVSGCPAPGTRQRVATISANRARASSRVPTAVSSRARLASAESSTGLVLGRRRPSRGIVSSEQQAPRGCRRPGRERPRGRRGR